MNAIRDWLQAQDLGEYCDLFERERINLDVLGELKEADLEKFGIPFGDRKRLLKAVAVLSTASPASAAPQPSTGPAPTLAPEAQRRQLTVMFCDLVGSTALSHRLDPEDLREVVRAYQQLCAGIVARLDGFVAQFLGDGILVYFGWPRAHENDAERAVRAGLGIVEAMQGPEAPTARGERLSVRIGIATGPVVIGELIGSASGKEASATGETPNLAARLQELAPANGIVIAPSTHALTGALFECVSLGERQFKGFQAPLSVWQVVRERPAESRFEAIRANRLVPFVGRENEIGLILERWQEAKAGEGQVVFLSGEAGIGKSRIVQTLRERIGSEPHTRLRYQCSPYYTSTAFHPFIAQLERAAGFAPEDTAATKLDKIEAIVAMGQGDPTSVGPLFAALLSVPTSGRYPALEMPAQQLKARIIGALTEQLVGLAAKQPVLLIFEDAHWADPTSLEVLDQTLGRMNSLRVLALITARPEFENRWAQHAHVTSLALNRLTRAQSSALVEGVTTGKTLPREVLEQIIAKTDGVPLFVEELTRTVLESGLLAERGDRLELTGPLPPLAIPATLQDSLMARLDRLDAVKELAQIGAAIGRDFPHKLLAAVAPLRDAELESGLDRLVASGLVFRQGSGESARYVFKHALVQDAAYGSLLKSRRQVLHERIARTLTEVSPETGGTQPEILAHHYTEAGFIEQAIDHWRKAGELAAKRSANVEAISHLTKGLNLLITQKESEARDRQEIALRASLMPALIVAKGMSAWETEQNIARAAALVERQHSVSEHFPILFGHWMVTGTKGDAVGSLRVAEHVAQLIVRHNDEVPRMMALRMRGASKFWLGRFREARNELEQSDAMYDPERHESLRFSHGVDLRVSNWCYFAIDEGIRGRPEKAARFAERALSLARSLDHVGTLTYCLMLAHVPANLQRADLLENKGGELLDLAIRHNLPQWVLAGRALIAASRAQSKRCAEAIAMYEECWNLSKSVRLKAFMTTLLAQFAECHCEVGNLAAGLQFLDEAQEIMNGGGERLFEAEVLRVGGRLLELAGNDTAAEASFRRALEVARAQDAKRFELGAARDLAALWKKQGKVAEARDFLAPIYGWFTEGFDTDDLKSAKALLDGLQAQAA